MCESRANPLHPLSLDSVLYMDCVEGMKHLPSNSIDLIVADPPFGIEFNGKNSAYNRQEDYVVEGYNEIDGDYSAFTESWVAELPRIMKNDASAYIFSGWNNLKKVDAACERHRLETVSHIIWKYNFGLFTRRKFVTSHYHILLVVKDPKKYYFNKMEHYPEDVWPINREYRPRELKNGTKLPLQLVEKCIDYSSRPGDLILDPFMGNGTTAAAAKAKFRHYLGFEINQELEEIIKAELARVELGQSHEWFDRKKHIQELTKKYPRAATAYRKRKGNRVKNAKE